MSSLHSLLLHYSGVGGAAAGRSVYQRSANHRYLRRSRQPLLALLGLSSGYITRGAAAMAVRLRAKRQARRRAGHYRVRPTYTNPGRRAGRQYPRRWHSSSADLPATTTRLYLPTSLPLLYALLYRAAERSGFGAWTGAQRVWTDGRLQRQERKNLRLCATRAALHWHDRVSTAPRHVARNAPPAHMRK